MNNPAWIGVKFKEESEINYNSKKRHSSLGLENMNFHGNMVLNTRVTPKCRVRDFGDVFHGIKGTCSRVQEDEYKCIKNIHKLIKGKTRVRHYLQ